MLYSQDVVHSALRDIDVMTLYYKSFDLAQTHDTIFITCFLAHLKAGTGDNNEANRAGMVTSAMTYIRTHNLPDNKIFMGDLNLYTSNEQAYKNLVYEYNGIQYFFDPIQREGNWNNNYDFRDVHTQSTHASNSPCFASGGLDDRFDIIMSSEALLQGTDKMQLLSNTYHALGNDGNHFNMNINEMPNNSAPGEVLDALFGMSDHLPVLTKIAVEATVGLDESNSDITAIRFQNPSPGLFNVNITLIKPQMIKMGIYDIFGRLVFSQNQYFGQEYISTSLSLNHLADGTYVLHLMDEKSNSISRKFVLKK